MLSLLLALFDRTITAGISVKSAKVGDDRERNRKKGVGQRKEGKVHFQGVKSAVTVGREKISCKSSWGSAGTRTGGRVISRQWND